MCPLLRKEDSPYSIPPLRMTMLTGFVFSIASRATTKMLIVLLRFIPALIGFKSIPVFGIFQTEYGPDFEGEKILIEKRDDSFLKDFPLMGVAEKWGIKVKAEYSIGGEGGWTDTNSTIAVCNSSEKTFLHEFVHVADLKGKKVPADGSAEHASTEVVAEFSASLLLQMLRPTEQPQKASSPFNEK